MSIRGVIFDLDSTLVDSVPLFMSAFKHAAKTCLHRNVVEQEILANLGPNEKGVFKKIAPTDWPMCLIEFYKYEKDHIDQVRLFDGVIYLLNFLKSNRIMLAVVTGRAEVHASLFLRKFDLEKYFDYIKVGDEDKTSKSPSIIDIVEKWSIRGDNAIYVGDTVFDIEAARNANVIPALACWSSYRIEQISNSSHVDTFSSVRELFYWLRERIKCKQLIQINVRRHKEKHF